ncbi:hypothetical protein GBAR_LOCUS13720 [Geodia barretti]|uniref:Uncharacterized protein n=1 Tax=Geodia barretti TaxID=519541 RepID=A0AA35WJ91_GEOBA|nr:hypothetical protein GBAR_LOCUS13720 [Geodia barretti]
MWTAYRDRTTRTLTRGFVTPVTCCTSSHLDTCSLRWWSICTLMTGATHSFSILVGVAFLLQILTVVIFLRSALLCDYTPKLTPFSPP